MTGTSLGRRICRAGVMVGTASALMGVLAPVAAHASSGTIVSWGPGTLAPGTGQCVQASAAGDVQVSGKADPPGVTFIVSRGGQEIFRTETRRNSLDKHFDGAGFYEFCAKNPKGLGVPVNNVYIQLATDDFA